MGKRWIGGALALAVGALAGQLAQPGAAAAAERPAIRLAPVVTSGLVSPLFVTHAGDGSGRLFVVEQPGRVRVVAPGGTLLPTPFLNLTDRVLAGGERGLLGLAFHPGYEANGRLFVSYTRQPDGASVVSELAVSGDPNAASPSSERVLLVVPQPFANHNGGMIAFGPGGLLFVALGDGGSAGDPGNRAQNPQELLGKILRIDVDGGGQPYGIPADNPFASGGQGRPEIYALGFRNPWRFSFDRRTGQLYAGDVGQTAFEEIDVVRRGANYGWRIMEGRSCYPPGTSCSRAGLAPPLTVYGHSGGRCSVTGGYVYRGRAVRALAGTYLYGDFCTGEIFGRIDRRNRVLLDTDLRIASFGEDEAGEVYVVDIRGGVHRIVRAGR
jgi:glucose/arabinose dehydrogenase